MLRVQQAHCCVHSCDDGRCRAGSEGGHPEGGDDNLFSTNTGFTG